jgi:succinate-semialdehyde dehydrogenase / glutarate-semialdehyde dehydrogenase
MIGLNRAALSPIPRRRSGLGREGGHKGLMEFLETQYISVTW